MVSAPVRQHGQEQHERRGDLREPKAFTFWMRLLPGGQRVSAWMLNMSSGGAALLTAAETAPAVGQQVELIEMQSRDRLVREDAGPLPRRARVLRHDDTHGATRRLALRFESDEPADSIEPDPARPAAVRMRFPRAPCTAPPVHGLIPLEKMPR